MWLSYIYPLYVIFMIFTYKIMITTNYKISYSSFNFDRKSTFSLIFHPLTLLKWSLGYNPSPPTHLSTWFMDVPVVHVSTTTQPWCRKLWLDLRCAILSKETSSSAKECVSWLPNPSRIWKQSSVCYVTKLYSERNLVEHIL